MSLLDLGALAQIFGAVTIFISFIFIIIDLRKNLHQHRAGKRVSIQFVPHQRRKPVMTLAEVDRFARHQNTHYISTRLKEALSALLAISSPIGTILKTKSGKRFSAAAMTNWFWLLYRDLGFEGCSSHSGRRTAITKWARTISQQVGGAMRDVQALARHSSLQQTQKYIEVSPDAWKPQDAP